jgi:LPXTG-motif cell wall-anchored protein
VPPVTPTPSTTPYASPLIPVAGGGTGSGYGTELAETGTDAGPLILIAGGAVLLGGILFAVILLRRRFDRAKATSADREPDSAARL